MKSLVKYICEYIDHTILKSVITDEMFKEFIDLANKFQFASLCVPPSLIRQTHELSPYSRISTVISFPYGFSNASTKYYECVSVSTNGAVEFDIVLNISNIVNHNWSEVEKELKTLKACCNYGIVKCIIETCYLSDYEISHVSELIAKYDINYVKTSTGYGIGGAALYQIELIKKAICGTNTKIKASGGIQTLEDCLKFICAGCDRIGTSNTKNIMKELENKE